MAIESLRKHSLFGGLSREALERIAPLLKEKKFAKGEFVVREGDSGGMLYFITDGRVEVLKAAGRGENVEQERLAVLKEGDTFGEMELIDIQCCAASIRAVTDVRLLTLSNMDMYKIYREDVEAFALIVMNMAREISRRLRRMDALLASSLYSEESRKSRAGDR